MSKENVALFIGASMDNVELNKKLAGAAQTIEAWVTVGKKAGYDFTADEMHEVVQEVMDKEMPKSAVIPALLANDKLSEKNLAQVSGGAGTATLAFSASLRTSFASAGYTLPGGTNMGSWGGHIKGPFSSMPGGGSVINQM